MLLKSLLLTFSFLCIISVRAQNLPSLLLNKNINATFSITAYDKQTQEWGIAVATNNIYVGNSTIYIQPGLGAFSVIAETQPSYAINGFEQLKLGKTIKEAIEYSFQNDSEQYLRQVAGIGPNGEVYAFTGASLKYWKGKAAHITGNSFVVIGNQLTDSTLTAMATAYQHANGTLAQRLLASLLAGQKAGGQITGKQSAALVVKGKDNEWFNQIDLRIDDSPAPFEDLQRLLAYHYGRIKLNQAIYALKAGNTVEGKIKLQEAIPMIKGWSGIYSKVAMAQLLSGDKEAAALTILHAIQLNPQWKENLPAFYCLATMPSLKSYFQVTSFTEKDWCSAIQLLLEINKANEAISLAQQQLKTYPSSSYIYYLLGKAWSAKGDISKARTLYTTAISLDTENKEAVQALAIVPK